MTPSRAEDRKSTKTSPRRRPKPKTAALDTRAERRRAPAGVPRADAPTVRREEIDTEFRRRQVAAGEPCVSAAAIAGTFLCGKLLAQAVERSDWSIELVDPKVLRVCADPHNMPFSTDRGEGFENKIAELLADKLGKGLSYSWYPQA